MNDNLNPDLARARRLGRTVAGPALAALAGLLAYQMLGEPLTALGAALGAGAVVVASWGRLVVRPEGVSYGRAVGVGFLATFAAFLGAAILGGGTSRVVAGGEAVSVALFALLMVLPVMIAAAVGLAAVLKAKAGA